MARSRLRKAGHVIPEDTLILQSMSEIRFDADKASQRVNQGTNSVMISTPQGHEGISKWFTDMGSFFIPFSVTKDLTNFAISKQLLSGGSSEGLFYRGKHISAEKECEVKGFTVKFQIPPQLLDGHVIFFTRRHHLVRTADFIAGVVGFVKGAKARAVQTIMFQPRKVNGVTQGYTNNAMVVVAPAFFVRGAASLAGPKTIQVPINGRAEKLKLTITFTPVKPFRHCTWCAGEHHFSKCPMKDEVRKQAVIEGRIVKHDGGIECSAECQTCFVNLRAGKLINMALATARSLEAHKNTEFHAIVSRDFRAYQKEGLIPPIAPILETEKIAKKRAREEADDARRMRARGSSNWSDDGSPARSFPPLTPIGVGMPLPLAPPLPPPPPPMPPMSDMGDDTMDEEAMHVAEEARIATPASERMEGVSPVGSYLAAARS
ncbi:hypothetical protein CYMTET_24906 [Cymbomonas tetramitiformis]|uniref:Uncharacterized protein n=1 Tax=Cymbomonas tetramitiformis TaxID=36881 RepID=A0AAE0FUW1_9CHLO|nr:hypothetical protein CYMTET_24906 [Cymbomonas tetramitiformis]